MVEKSGEGDVGEVAGFDGFVGYGDGEVGERGLGDGRGVVYLEVECDELGISQHNHSKRRKRIPLHIPHPTMLSGLYQMQLHLLQILPFFLNRKRRKVHKHLFGVSLFHFGMIGNKGVDGFHIGGGCNLEAHVVECLRVFYLDGNEPDGGWLVGGCEVDEDDE